MPTPVKWTARKLANLQRRIDEVWNPTVEDWERRGFDDVPNRTTVQRERAFIKTEEDYRSRMAQLKRIEEPGADVPVFFRGEVVPDFLRIEIENEERARSEHRQVELSRVHKDWSEMTPQERAILATTDSLMEPMQVEVGGDYLDALEEQRWSDKTVVWWENYRAELIDNVPDARMRDEILDTLDKFMMEKPDELHDIISRGDPEAQIEYIYPDSAFIESSLWERYDNLLDYWRNRSMEYFGMEVVG